MRTVDLDVEGGRLRTLRWGSGEHVAVAVHGITANAMAWSAVADALPPDWSLVAIDLRGRGHSRDLPGPYDADQHAHDIRVVAAATGARVLAGHSLGAYLTLGTQHLFPDVADRIVLVDGGLPLPVPDDVDPDEVLQTTLGPALTRLRETWPDITSYVDFFRSHPAMGPYWSTVVEAYATYDALVEGGVVRPRAVEEAVRTSGRELLTRSTEIGDALMGLSVPADLLVAGRGMFDQDGGLLPDSVVQEWTGRQPGLRLTSLADVNHYTILFDRDAATQVAGAIAGGG